MSNGKQMRGQGHGSGRGAPSQQDRNESKKIVLFTPDGNHINPELLDKTANSWAEFICDNRNLPNHQLRRFFGEFKLLQRRLGSDKSKYADRWPDVLPRLKMIKAQAHYAKNRKPPKITHDFNEFLIQIVDLSTTPEKFVTVCQFFEAVVAYSAGRVKEQ